MVHRHIRHFGWTFPFVFGGLVIAIGKSWPACRSKFLLPLTLLLVTSFKIVGLVSKDSLPVNFAPVHGVVVATGIPFTLTSFACFLLGALPIMFGSLPCRNFPLALSRSQSSSRDANEPYLNFVRAMLGLACIVALTAGLGTTLSLHIGALAMKTSLVKDVNTGLVIALDWVMFGGTVSVIVGFFLWLTPVATSQHTPSIASRSQRHPRSTHSLPPPTSVSQSRSPSVNSVAQGTYSYNVQRGSGVHRAGEAEILTRTVIEIGSEERLDPPDMLGLPSNM